MRFLALNRFADTRRRLPLNQAAEDAFCARLKMLGPDWYALPPDFSKRAHLGPKEQFACETLESCFTPDRATAYVFAWPERDHVYAPAAEGPGLVCYIRRARVERDGRVARGLS